MSVKENFGKPIRCHSWNGNRSQVAICPNDNTVELYQAAGGKFKKTDTFDEHGQDVTGIDWAPESNKIVTCAADRNAYVWTPQPDGTWKNGMVILRMNRAATCVKWSPKENKFAVGSGERLISVCHFDQDNDWWVSSHIKRFIRSTVTSIDWHPNNILIAAGSTDFKARVFSGYKKEVEPKPEPTCWGNKMTFAALMGEFSNGGGGWIHSVKFSSSGERLAWIGHDSSISVVDGSSGNAVATLKTKYLPFMTMVWTNDNTIMAAGHDCSPLLFTYKNGTLAYLKTIEEEGTKAATGGKISAMEQFKSLSLKGQSADNTSLTSTHQNTILQVSVHTGNASRATKVCTTGIDGLLVLWEI